MKLLFTFSAIVIFFSCQNSPHDKCQSADKEWKFKKMFETIADTNASICISSGQLYLFTHFIDELGPFNESDSARFLKVYSASSNDTLVLKQTSTALSDKEFQNLYSSNKGKSLCFDSLNTYSYQYDSTFPVKLKLVHGEEIDKISIVDSLSVCTTTNSATWETYVHAFYNGKLLNYEIADPRETVDFFLYDITGDTLPEIFIVKHFMTPSTVVGDTPMIDLEIYKIEKVTKDPSQQIKP